MQDMLVILAATFTNALMDINRNRRQFVNIRELKNHDDGFVDDDRNSLPVVTHKLPVVTHKMLVTHLQCTAQARLVNFVVVVSSTTPNIVESRRPAIHKLHQV